MPAKRKIDWTPARRWFVEGTLGEKGVRTLPTMKEIAEKYGVSIKAVQKMIRREKWHAERAAFTQKVEEQRAQKIAEQLGEMLADFDLRAAVAAKIGIARVTTLIQREGATPGQLLSLSETLGNFHKIGRISGDKVTDIVQTNADVKVAAVDWTEVINRISDSDRKRADEDGANT